MFPLLITGLLCIVRHPQPMRLHALVRRDGRVGMPYHSHRLVS
ncbi:hypothetical protein [Novacetimonas hansenii]|nr:hypothetical protein [Novacetimonas hansenii]GAN82843.1 hypothetical protein Gaha_0048_002 [Novacetimonas hansenii JCM 7643]